MHNCQLAELVGTLTFKTSATLHSTVLDGEDGVTVPPRALGALRIEL